MTQAAILDDNFDRDWGADAVATIIALSIAQETLSSDDLRREMRPPNRSSQVGAAFRSAQSQGLIESCGYKKSTSKTRNSGSHQVWRRKTEGITS